MHQEAEAQSFIYQHSHAALATVGTGDAELFGAYMYSRAQSVMGGTSQIQKNIIAQRICGMGGSR